MCFFSLQAIFFLAYILFLLNGILGDIQYGNKNLFQYGKFSFARDEEQNFSGNFFLKIVNPTVFSACIACVIQKSATPFVINYLWVFVFFFWLIRFAYLLFKNYLLFVNSRYEISSFIASVILFEAVFFSIIKPLFECGESIAIPVTELRNAVWYAIIAYLVSVVWKIAKSKFEDYAVYPAERREEIIEKRYDKFAEKFGRTILSNSAEAIPQFGLCNKDDMSRFNTLIYSIMIFEDYNRPSIIRFLERMLFLTGLKKKMSLGIMQVVDTKMITDEESIRLAMEKLLPFFVKDGEIKIERKAIYDSLQDYNKNYFYPDEVFEIYTVLSSMTSLDKEINENIIENAQI